MKIIIYMGNPLFSASSFQTLPSPHVEIECSNITSPTKEDIFEQIVEFTLSENYMAVKGLIDYLKEKSIHF